MFVNLLVCSPSRKLVEVFPCQIWLEFHSRLQNCYRLMRFYLADCICKHTGFYQSFYWSPLSKAMLSSAGGNYDKGYPEKLLCDTAQIFSDVCFHNLLYHWTYFLFFSTTVCWMYSPRCALDMPSNTPTSSSRQYLVIARNKHTLPLTLFWTRYRYGIMKANTSADLCLQVMMEVSSIWIFIFLCAMKTSVVVLQIPKFQSIDVSNMSSFNYCYKLFSF
jgi:hypothetical protein